MRRVIPGACLRVIFVLLPLLLSGCDEPPPMGRFEGDLVAGKAVELCDATIRAGQGTVTIERHWNPELVALIAVIAFWFLVSLVWVLLGKVRRRVAVIASLLLLLLAGGLTAFLGNERYTLQQKQGQVQLDEGWFLDLYFTRRKVAYTPTMHMSFEEDEQEDSHYMYLLLHLPETKMQVVICKATLTTKESLRQGLPRLARTLERLAGLRRPASHRSLGYRVICTLSQIPRVCRRKLGRSGP